MARAADRFIGIAIAAAIFLWVSQHGAQAGAATLTTLYTFTGLNGDGANPYGGVVIASKGALYGTTATGGVISPSCTLNSSGCGSIFKLSPPSAAGGNWTETVLYSFTGGSDGANPYAGLVIGKGGVLFGTTQFGSVTTSRTCDFAGCGTVFRLTPEPGGTWTETVLYGFKGNGDGVSPKAGVLVDSDGALHGTTFYGGGVNCSLYGCGEVFRLAPPSVAGGTWTEAISHSFVGYPGDGANPYVALAMDSNGTLYGTTLNGGAAGNGAVFQLTPPSSTGSGWSEALLYSFTGYTSATDGYRPAGSLIIGIGGVLYGTTSKSGISGHPAGTIFQLAPPVTPGGAWTETILYAFAGGSDGAHPAAGLVQDTNGALYGTTMEGGDSGAGTLFKLTPPAISGGAWTETVLHSFSGSDGRYPRAGLVIGRGGLLYGTTSEGGSTGYGTVFELKP